VVPKNFFMLLNSYQNHPEAKSLGPDGNPCDSKTRGLLQRAHIIASWPPIYIGKESDRHWEEGDDLSLLDFKTVQYTRKGNVVAGNDQAYSSLALVYTVLGEAPYDALLPREANRKARVAAERALELDPSLAQAHAALGITASHDWDLRSAEREYRLALGLDPNDSSIHEWLGDLLMAEGKTKEALEEGQRSLELDPVSPASHAFMAQAYYYAGDYDKSIEQARHIVEIQPRFIQARYWLGSAYREKKMYKEAIEQFRLAREASGDNSAMVMAYGYTQALAGNPAEAHASLSQLEARSKHQYVPAIYFAGIYLGLEDKPNSMNI
jgi:adenylate cyclase